MPVDRETGEWFCMNCRMAGKNAFGVGGMAALMAHQDRAECVLSIIKGVGHA